MREIPRQSASSSSSLRSCRFVYRLFSLSKCSCVTDLRPRSSGRNSAPRAPSEGERKANLWGSSRSDPVHCSGESRIVARTRDMVDMMDIYTADEVARHNNSQDLWLVIHGVVYDITKFFKEHPGGEEVLLEVAGQDATKCFDAIGHSLEAINLREHFKIGELAVDGVSSGKSETKKTTTTTELEENPMENDRQYHQPKSQIDLIFKYGIIVYIIYAIVYYWLW